MAAVVGKSLERLGKTMKAKVKSKAPEYKLKTDSERCDSLVDGFLRVPMATSTGIRGVGNQGTEMDDKLPRYEEISFPEPTLGRGETLPSYEAENRRAIVQNFGSS